MKISRNWLEDYIMLDMSDEALGDILTDLGLEVEGMEQFESVKGGLSGVVIGKVLTCEKHPDADKLSVTTVDLGAGEPVQIVCGAPNVAAGQTVPVATVGATLYTDDGGSFKIKKAKIRGQVSEGMICAEDELGLGDSHAGIMVLPDELEAGMQAADYFKVERDTVYEIGLTPNRSDATSHLGVAKDLSAFLRFHKDEKKYAVRPPSTDVGENIKGGTPVEVVVEDAELCPRYSGVVIRDLQIGESPDWLKSRLEAIDVRPINNVVDVTNYILHEMGQPLHAFDMRELVDNKVIVKTLPDGTAFTTLDEQERKLMASDLMICNGKGEGMCIAGVFGGLGSGVKDDTTAIFLESAHFNASAIRKTSMGHLLRTDAAKVFEKGSDPSVTVEALERAVTLLKEICGGRIDSEIVDIYPKPVSRARVLLRREKVQNLIGLDLTGKEIERLLDVLDMEVLNKKDGSWEIAIPTDKSDVTREVDVIEELLRVYGFNQVPLTDDVRSTIARQVDERPINVRETLSNVLEGFGFAEMMGFVLTPSKFLKDSMGVADEDLVYINNTSNIHLDAMRPSLLVSALEAVRHNINRQQSDVRLFEVGKSYKRDAEAFHEKWELSITMTGNRYPESWINTGEDDSNFFSLKGYVDALLAKSGIGHARIEEISADPWYHYGAVYRLGKFEIARFGAVHPSLLKDAEIKQPVYFAVFDIENILRLTGNSNIKFERIPKYPESRRDLALVVDEAVQFSAMEQIARKAGGSLLKEVNLFDVYHNAQQIGEGKKSYALSFIFRDDEKTIEDKQVDAVMKKMIKGFSEKLGANIRQ